MAFKSAFGPHFVKEEEVLRVEDIQPGHIPVFGTDGKMRDGGPLSAVTQYTNVSHAALTTLVNNNSLTIGSFYIITDHVTKYQQPITGTIKTGTPEPLMVLAISTNKFHKQAYSAAYPNDIIHYDFTNVLCEDNSTPRTGKITYRWDTVNNNYAFYDIRNVQFVRYPISQAAFPSWTTTQNYSPGTMIVEGGIIYRCRLTHFSGTFSTDLFSKKWERVNSINGNLFWDISGQLLGGTVYTSGVATEYYTFGSDCKNCYVKQNRLEPYNNIVIERGVDISVEDDCVNGTISGNISDISPNRNFISSGCNNFIINCSDSNVVGSLSAFFFIGVLSHQNTLGKQTLLNYISEGSKGNTIKDYSSGNYINDYAHYNTIDELCTYNYLDVSSRNNKILPSSNNIALHSSANNTFGSFCADISLAYATGNRFASNCSSISNLTISAFDYGSMFGNDFGPYCNDIIIAGAGQLLYSKFDNRCNNIDINSLISHCSFGNQCGSLVINANLISSHFSPAVTNKTFNNVFVNSSWLVGDSSSLTITTAITNTSVTVKSPDGRLWYPSIDNSGATSMNDVI